MISPCIGRWIMRLEPSLEPVFLVLTIQLHHLIIGMLLESVKSIDLHLGHIRPLRVILLLNYPPNNRAFVLFFHETYLRAARE